MTVPIDTEFDVAFANRIARMEAYNKHHYRPNSYLHKWWARRCGSTFRLILKQLVEAPERRDYYAPGGLEGKLILDPMMGGGTTLHEAIRMGANVIGADLDPIPVLQARATLSDAPLARLAQAYGRFYQALKAEVEPSFRTTCPHCERPTAVNYVLYGVKRQCNGRSVLVVDSLVLRIETDGTVIRLCPDCHAVVSGDETCDCPAHEARLPILEKGAKQFGGETAVFEDDFDVPYYARYVPLVIVGRCPAEKGLFFKPPDAADLDRIAQADARRVGLPLAREEFAIEPGRKSRQLLARGVDNYLDLFSSRQLIYLDAAIKLLPDFEPLMRLNLGLLVSTSLEFNSLLCGYKGKNKRRAGAIRHTFSHHAYSFPYTALENNPVYRRRASGTLQKLFKSRIQNGRVWANTPRERRFSDDKKKSLFVEIEGERDAGAEIEDLAELRAHDCRRFLLRQGSSTQLDLPDDSVDFIVTDPPYFDSVQYSDLAAFFRVWLRRLLPDAAHWTYDTRQSAVDPHKLDRESRYTEIISGIFGECGRVLRPDGRFIFTFHHWNPKGWAALALALKQADFALVNRYVVHSEHPISVHISNMKSLTHDAILVLAPRKAGVQGEWEQPSRIDLNDSEQFCRDCGALLGWLLQSDPDDVEIERIWQEALA